MNTRHESSSRGISPFGQFGILLGLLGLGFILAGIVSIIIVKVALGVPLSGLAAALLDPKNVQVARVVQIVSTLVLFAVPALLFAVIVNKQPFRYLGFATHSNFRQFYLVLLIAIAALFSQSILSQLNEWIPISKHWEQVFKRMEDEYAKEVLNMVQMKTFADYVYSLIIIAFLPALFEELFFRGALQQMFIGMFRNAFWGILITSIFFSAAHFSYYGFLTRLFLGLVLGYIFYYGKNIWLNVTMHFLNNAVVVTGLYLLSRSGKLTEKSMQDDNYPVFVGIIAIIGVLALFVMFKRECMKTVLVTHDGVTEDYQLDNRTGEENNNIL